MRWSALHHSLLGELSGSQMTDSAHRQYLPPMEEQLRSRNQHKSQGMNTASLGQTHGQKLGE